MPPKEASHVRRWVEEGSDSKQKHTYSYTARRSINNPIVQTNAAKTLTTHTESSAGESIIRQSNRVSRSPWPGKTNLLPPQWSCGPALFSHRISFGTRPVKPLHANKSRCKRKVRCVPLAAEQKYLFMFAVSIPPSPPLGRAGLKNVFSGKQCSAFSFSRAVMESIPRDKCHVVWKNASVKVSRFGAED